MNVSTNHRKLKHFFSKVLHLSKHTRQQIFGVINLRCIKLKSSIKRIMKFILCILNLVKNEYYLFVKFINVDLILYHYNGNDNILH